MTSSSLPPASLLARHVAARATGELICVSEGLEVHLYLQAGRIAWGTTTEERFVFRKHLLEAYGVETRAIEEALADCQRTRRPLGETLVAWGLVTAEQVKAGLKAQVLSALRSLERCQAAQTLFLPRGEAWSSYDASLTFELDELRPGPPPPPPSTPTQLVEVLGLQVPSSAWTAVVAGREVVAQSPGQPAGRVLELARRVGPELDVLLLRASSGSLVGGHIGPDGHALWCALPAEAPVYELFSRLAELPSTGRRPTPPPQALGAFQRLGPTPERVQEVEQILSRVEGPVGLVVLDRGGTPDLWALGRVALPLPELASLAAERQRVLDTDVFSVRAARNQLGFQSVVLRDERWWWFGADLRQPTPASAWLALPRSASSELGGAVLATLVRHLGTLEVADD